MRRLERQRHSCMHAISAHRTRGCPVRHVVGAKPGQTKQARICERLRSITSRRTFFTFNAFVGILARQTRPTSRSVFEAKSSYRTLFTERCSANWIIATTCAYQTFTFMHEKESQTVRYKRGEFVKCLSPEEVAYEKGEQVRSSRNKYSHFVQLCGNIREWELDTFFA